LKARGLTWALLPALLLAVCLASVSVGPYSKVGIVQVFEALSGRGAPSTYLYILSYRLMRTAAAIVIGVSLASAGASLQYTLRNPLVDPYLAGVSSGALLGVTLMIYLGHTGFLELYVAALAGGLATLAAVTLISLLAGGGASTFLITGVAASYVLTGVTMFLMIGLGPKLPGALYWMFGSVAFVTRPLLLRSAAVAALSIAGIATLTRYINTFMLGDDVAKSLGVSTGLLRTTVFALASSATSAVVAMSGPVGFIGLVSPWLARRVYGSSFSLALPAAAMIGATLAVASDIAARLILYPSEAPLTAVTSVFGAPLLVYILLKSRGESPW